MRWVRTRGFDAYLQLRLDDGRDLWCTAHHVKLLEVEAEQLEPIPEEADKMDVEEPAVDSPVAAHATAPATDLPLAADTPAPDTPDLPLTADTPAADTPATAAESAGAEDDNGDGKAETEQAEAGRRRCTACARFPLGARRPS